jgi:hypothetical protein
MSDAGRRPPTLEEMAEPHQCWWRAMAEGLCDVLAVLDNDSQVSAKRGQLQPECQTPPSGLDLGLGAGLSARPETTQVIQRRPTIPRRSTSLQAQRSTGREAVTAVRR